MLKRPTVLDDKKLAWIEKELAEGRGLAGYVVADLLAEVKRLREQLRRAIPHLETAQAYYQDKKEFAVGRDNRKQMAEAYAAVGELLSQIPAPAGEPSTSA